MPTASLFVSSVQKELAEERRAIRDFVAGDALLSRFFRVFLFEDLPAGDRRADEMHLAAVDGGPESRPESESGSESGSESAAPWWRMVSMWRAEWRSDSVHERVLRALQERSLSRSGLAAALANKSTSRSLRRALDDLMKAGLVAYTLPEKPGSRLQRYRAVRPERA